MPDNKYRKNYGIIKSQFIIICYKIIDGSGSLMDGKSIRQKVHWVFTCAKVTLHRIQVGLKVKQDDFTVEGSGYHQRSY